MPFDDVGMSGEGTLKEYFTHEAEPSNDDGIVDRLQLELFTKLSGLNESETMQVFWPDDDYPWVEDEEEAFKLAKATMKALKAKTHTAGLVLIGVQPDDPILALYKDGEPVAAFYASYRGVYQAGAYVASGVNAGRHYFAHNMFEADPERPQDEWIEDYEAGCSQIAQDFLLGRRTY